MIGVFTILLAKILLIIAAKLVAIANKLLGEQEMTWYQKAFDKDTINELEAIEQQVVEQEQGPREVELDVIIVTFTFPMSTFHELRRALKSLVLKGVVGMTVEETEILTTFLTNLHTYLSGKKGS